MNISVTYRDSDGYSRWGYVAANDMHAISEYFSIRHKLENGENEILREKFQQLSRQIINVYLPDGKIGDAKIEHLDMVKPFAQYLFKKSEENQDV